MKQNCLSLLYESKKNYEALVDMKYGLLNSKELITINYIQYFTVKTNCVSHPIFSSCDKEWENIQYQNTDVMKKLPYLRKFVGSCTCSQLKSFLST